LSAFIKNQKKNQIIFCTCLQMSQVSDANTSRLQ